METPGGQTEISSEFIKKKTKQNCGTTFLEWLNNFFSSCLQHLSIPKIRCKTLVVAIPKLNKPADVLKSCKLISLLCVLLKLLERLPLALLEPVAGSLLPKPRQVFDMDVQHKNKLSPCTTSRPRSLRDGVPQGYTLFPSLHTQSLKLCRRRCLTVCKRYGHWS